MTYVVMDCDVVMLFEHYNIPLSLTTHNIRTQHWQVFFSEENMRIKRCVKLPRQKYKDFFLELNSTPDAE